MVLPTLPPLETQFALVSGIQPCPLQLFKPLQLLVAVWHDEVPLHELTPEHSTFAMLAFCIFIDEDDFSPAEPHADNNKTAAAEANVIFDTFFAVFISILL